MFGSRYFANRYWGARYYGHFGATAAPVSGQYMGPRYFGRRYWNQKTSEVDGSYNGSRYFGNRYFAKRYFGANQTSDPFAIVQTNVLAGSGASTTSSSSFTIGTDWPVAQTNSLLGAGTSGFNTSLTFDNENWYLENYLQLAQATGSSAFSTDIQLGYAAAGGRYFGYRYFGTRYYGARYWSTLTGWSLEITQHLSGAGVPTHSAAIGLPLTFTPSTVIFGSAAGGFGSIALGFNEPIVVSISGAPGQGHGRRTAKSERYLVLIDGEKHYGTREEIEAIIESLAKTNADKPKRKKPRISVKPIEKQDVAAPEAKIEAAEIQADMRDTYAELYRRAMENLEMQEEDDLVGLL